MQVEGRPYRSIWYEAGEDRVRIIDQTLLPHQFLVREVENLEAMAEAITAMRVRGAPLIGVSAAFGVYLAMRDRPRELDRAVQTLRSTRPTAVNLDWALSAVKKTLDPLPPERRAEAALQSALALADQDVATCEAIGDQGSRLLMQIWQARKDKSTPLQVLTHCNAGWLATVDWGTALSVLYKADAAGIPLHVWVDETRPRNQGANLTAWELQQQGIACTLIADNTGGHLMQIGAVDLCLVGSDRTTAAGDVCNKIGTYLKALAAHDNGVPFYVALPVSTIDFRIRDGLREIPIEQRDASELLSLSGPDADGNMRSIRLSHPAVKAGNYAFDVTPARLVTGLITECGVCPANSESIAALQSQAGR